MGISESERENAECIWVNVKREILKENMNIEMDVREGYMLRNKGIEKEQGKVSSEGFDLSTR